MQAATSVKRLFRASQQRDASDLDSGSMPQSLRAGAAAAACVAFPAAAHPSCISPGLCSELFSSPVPLKEGTGARVVCSHAASYPLPGVIGSRFFAPAEQIRNSRSGQERHPLRRHPTISELNDAVSFFPKESFLLYFANVGWSLLADPEDRWLSFCRQLSKRSTSFPD